MNKKTRPRTVEALVGKYAAAEREIVRARGQFSLFGLFRHEERPEKLDLLIAAPWLKTDRSGLLQIAPYLPKLTSEEGQLIGRIVALEPDDTIVAELREIARGAEADEEAWTFTSTPIPDFPITEGWVIAPPVTQT